MRIEFLLGPAGSGKTFRCLQQSREALQRSPEGLPLVFIAPKQATYQLERQLLQDESLSGYTRLHILSFERLCRWIFKQAGEPEPALLSEEGRIMVLRALLARHSEELKVFRPSARAGGFARELSRLIRALQQSRISASRLREFATRAGEKNRLGDKLADLALLLERYQSWLKSEELEDADRLTDLAAALLERSTNLKSHSRTSDLVQPWLFPQEPNPSEASRNPVADIQFESIWLDGFARLTLQEQRLLKALAPRCQKMTLAFCLNSTEARPEWHSHWFAVQQAFSELRSEMESLKGAQVLVSTLERMGELAKSGPAMSRFAQAELQHLERFWAEPKPYPENGPLKAIRLIECVDPEAEAVLAAREILRYVRQGGRFRETAVLVRDLEKYHDVLRRVFLRYEIPFFLDRRESIAHHPLAELVRGTLRTLAYNWKHRDWFCALKSGLLPASANEIDRLENEALARGWEGTAWHKPIVIRNEPELSAQFEALRKRLTSPLMALGERLTGKPTGKELAEALVDFWKGLKVDEQLEEWSRDWMEHGPMHLTVWEQSQQWAQNLTLALGNEAQTLTEWLPIIESGLENLSVGVIPPVLDQVLLGAVDRSRNPDLQRVFVLGLNEGVFPAPISAPPILSELDQVILEKECRVSIGSNARLQMAQERFFGYIACTRAREQVVLTYAIRDVEGAPLNPSSLVTHIRRLFPQLKNPETFAITQTWQTAEHQCELIAPLLKAAAMAFPHTSKTSPSPLNGERAGVRAESIPNTAFAALSNLPRIAPILARLQDAQPTVPGLSPTLARALYGRVHETSVSALEKFGSCPFWFFIDSGLKAEEREQFKLDPRQTGTFQHRVLERFHLFLKSENKLWHSITPEYARQQIGRIADEEIETFEEGMLKMSHKNRFSALQQKQRLQRFIHLLVVWMKQYQFEPAAVELSFGLARNPLPAWQIEAVDGYSLAVRGSIDRVDLHQPEGSEETLCVVMDYKLRGKEIKEVLMANGIQLQLPAYLAALRTIDNAKEILGAENLRPVGVFFVNLSGNYSSAANRNAAVADQLAVHKAAFQHIGRFDAEALDFLDSRGAESGDQFSYKRKADGNVDARTKGPMSRQEFLELLRVAEEQVREFGRRIYKGDISVDPYQYGTTRACKYCEHLSICRMDPWLHRFRQLKKEAPAEEEEAAALSSA